MDDFTYQMKLRNAATDRNGRHANAKQLSQALDLFKEQGTVDELGLDVILALFVQNRFDISTALSVTAGLRVESPVLSLTQITASKPHGKKANRWVGLLSVQLHDDFAGILPSVVQARRFRRRNPGKPGYPDSSIVEEMTIN